MIYFSFKILPTYIYLIIYFYYLARYIYFNNISPFQLKPASAPVKMKRGCNVQLTAVQLIVHQTINPSRSVSCLPGYANRGVIANPTTGLIIKTNSVSLPLSVVSIIEPVEL